MMDSMTVQEAYLKWQKELTDWSDTCCIHNHYYVDEKGYILWKRDQDVCKRELAWRIYVRLRDDNPYFPFSKNAWH